jgi:hypothetical protein
VAVESILQYNQHEHVIWKVWNRNPCSTVQPMPEFHEVCTANDVIDQGEVTDAIQMCGVMDSKLSHGFGPVGSKTVSLKSVNIVVDLNSSVCHYYNNRYLM